MREHKLILTPAFDNTRCPTSNPNLSTEEFHWVQGGKGLTRDDHITVIAVFNAGVPLQQYHGLSLGVIGVTACNSVLESVEEVTEEIVALSLIENGLMSGGKLKNITTNTTPDDNDYFTNAVVLYNTITYGNNTVNIANQIQMIFNPGNCYLSTTTDILIAVDYGDPRKGYTSIKVKAE